MNTKILCFGDSHTRGQIPWSQERFSSTERWTWLLQDALWSEYVVIEEGLPWRTTNQDHPSNLEGIEQIILGLVFFLIILYIYSC